MTRTNTHYNDLYNTFGTECIQIDLVGEIYSGDKRIGSMFLHKRMLGFMYVACTTLGIAITWTENTNIMSSGVAEMSDIKRIKYE